MSVEKKPDPASKPEPDGSDHEKEDALVDVGSEYSFPASDPPSYMGGTAVAGPPPHEGPPREPVSHELLSPNSERRDNDSPHRKDPARKPD
jgi:hypothetical protein